MTSHFAQLTEDEERQAIPWQTSPLKSCSQNAKWRLCRVAEAIEQHFLSAEWKSWRVKGSITFQHRRNRKEVVRVFIDKDNKLARKYNLLLTDEPIVVCVDLTAKTPYERLMIRGFLRSQHRQYYVDPTTGSDKIWTKLDKSHKFDVIFIPEGPCELPMNEQRIEEIFDAIEHERRIF